MSLHDPGIAQGSRTGDGNRICARDRGAGGGNCDVASAGWIRSGT